MASSRLMSAPFRESGPRRQAGGRSFVVAHLIVEHLGGLVSLSTFVIPFRFFVILRSAIARPDCPKSARIHLERSLGERMPSPLRRWEADKNIERRFVQFTCPDAASANGANRPCFGGDNAPCPHPLPHRCRPGVRSHIIQPIYTAAKAQSAYQLSWGLTFFCRQMPVPGD